MSGGWVGSQIAAGLRRGPVWFLSRGAPGLGRVMPSVSLAQLCRQHAPDVDITFFTSRPVIPLVRRLLPARVGEFDFDSQQDPTTALFELRPVESLVLEASRRRPEVVVIDGYPALIPVLRSVLGCLVVALANAHDLENPAYPAARRALMEGYHAAAHLVIVGELRVGWEIGESRAGWTLRLPALVRQEVVRAMSQSQAGGAGGVVAVMGGGCRGAPDMEELVLGVLARLDSLASLQPRPRWRAFLGPSSGFDTSRWPHLDTASDGSGCLGAMIDSEVMVARSGRNTLAEACALGLATVAITPVGADARSREQVSQAELAGRLSPRIAGLPVDQLDSLAAVMDAVQTRPGGRWEPGNRWLMAALESGAARGD